MNEITHTVISDEDRQQLIACLVRSRGHKGTTEEQREALLTWATMVRIDNAALDMMLAGFLDVDVNIEEDAITWKMHKG